MNHKYIFYTLLSLLNFSVSAKPYDHYFGRCNSRELNEQQQLLCKKHERRHAETPRVVYQEQKIPQHSETLVYSTKEVDAQPTARRATRPSIQPYIPGQYNRRYAEESK